MIDTAYLFESVFEDEQLWESFMDALADESPETLNEAVYDMFHKTDQASMHYKVMASILERMAENVQI